MKNRLGMLGVALVVVVGLVVQLVAFQVRETERAVVLTFGEATRELSRPGLYFKWPWPVEEVVKLDARLVVLESPLEECQTEDGKALVVGSFLAWSVKDPLAFLKTFGNGHQHAAPRLERDLRDAQKKAIGQFAWASLVNAEREKLRWDDVEKEIRRSLEESFARQYRVGDRAPIEVAFVGMRKLALPESTTERVFERMKAEREALAAEILAEGDAEAAQLRAKAEVEARRALDQAEADAKTALAEAERAASEHQAIFGQDEDLAIFLRKVEALKRVLAKRSTIVLDTKAPPFDLLAPPPADPKSGGGK